MIVGLHHIAILCSDADSALRFYGALGFRVFRQNVREERKDAVYMLEGHGITIELFIHAQQPERVTQPEAYGLRHLALRVTEIEELFGALKAAGYAPEAIRNDSFSGEKMCFVTDPDGLPIELHE